jgi:hypothetical protein
MMIPSNIVARVQNERPDRSLSPALPADDSERPGWTAPLGGGAQALFRVGASRMPGAAETHPRAHRAPCGLQPRTSNLMQLSVASISGFTYVPSDYNHRSPSDYSRWTRSPDRSPSCSARRSLLQVFVRQAGPICSIGLRSQQACWSAYR